MLKKPPLLGVFCCEYYGYNNNKHIKTANMKKNNRLETRILKAMFSYKNIIVASAWGLTAYGSMYAWMYLIMFIFGS